MKPILFNTEMVRAILDRRKTVTRRVLKTEKHIPDDAVFGYTGFTPKGYISCRGTFVDENGNKRYGESYIKAPYCKGDILYVRETWNYLPMPDTLRGASKTYWYKADGTEVGDGWIPSIHMPKEAARVFLRVTGIKIERLQDMTLDDFLAEGIILRPEAFNDTDNAYLQAKSEFSKLWNSTIKKSDLEKYGWDANPWVTVNEFERISKEEAYGTENRA